MKIQILLFFLSLAPFRSFAQFVIRAEGVYPENACVPDAIYFLTEHRAKPLDNVDSIKVRLTRATKIVKQYPSFESKAAIQFVVNCRGELGGGFHIVTPSGKDSLDAQLIGFFKTLKKWRAGTLDNKPVDSWYMWKLEIKKGNVTIINF